MNSRFSRFELVLSAYCVVLTAGAIAYSLWISEPPAAAPIAVEQPAMRGTPSPVSPVPAQGQQGER